MQTIETLPKRVYKQHNAYYYVENNKWHWLCRDKADIQAALDNIVIISSGEYRLEMLRFTKKVVTRARQNAKGRKINFSLDGGAAEKLLQNSGWRCAVSGLKFELHEVNGKKPYAPSIDRIISSEGYHMDNCRVVCVAVNYAMNVWGDRVFMKIARAVR